MTKGELLNLRVWKVFQKAGFTTRPSDQSSEEHNVMLSPKKPRPVDLYAEDKKLKVKIIGSNKSGINVKPFSGHIVDYSELGKKEKASTVLFVVTTKEVGSADRELIKERKMVLWGQRELDYYDALSDAIGPFAKYEIIHSLGLKTHEEKDTHHVLALRLRQPSDDGSHEMYMFTTTPDRLLKTSVVFRRASNNADAYQRMLQAKRLPGIAKFVATSNALLPTNVILKLGPKVSVDEIPTDDLKDTNGDPIVISAVHSDLVRLNIPMEYGSLELIDGQHRLFGFTKTEPATRGSFNLVVLGLRGLEDKQERDTFVAINDNA